MIGGEYLATYQLLLLDLGKRGPRHWSERRAATDADGTTPSKRLRSTKIAAQRRGFGEVFGSIRPVGIMYEVNRFIKPEWLIEIEVDALIDPDGAAWT
jgi:hypothetical protein